MIGIGELHEFGQSHVFIDYESGETGRLFEFPKGGTGVGRTIADGSPPAARVLARKNGRPLLDGKPLTPLPTTRRSFEIDRGDVKLAGELILPGASPKGALVLVHGSGAGPRRAYDTWSNFFVAREWAVVVFDKRGSGQSSGDWHEADFAVLADDVRAVLKWSRSQHELKDLRFGLWGVSQAGWIIPQVAAEGPVDFAIVQAGPSTPTDEFIGRTVESELRAYEFSREEIAKAKAYYELEVAVSRGEQPFAAIESAYQVASAAGAEWLLKPPDPANAPDRRFMAKIAGYDPAPFWRRVRIPLLILFGGKDHVVPVEPNRARFETLLAEAGNRDAQIVTLENDNHLNMLAKTGVRTEYATLNRFDPKYFETLARFLEQVSASSRSR
jgi:pimeloyl-ACP methyl ester carboxylesterase